MEIRPEKTCTSKQITDTLNSKPIEKPYFYDNVSIQHAPREEKADINEDFFACHEIGHFFDKLSQEQITQIMLTLFHKIASACQINEEGSTLIIAFYYGDWVTLASVGDSSALIVERFQNGNIKCKQINHLHSAENDNEVKRLFLIGGHQIIGKRLNGSLQPLRTVGNKSVTHNDLELSKPDIYHLKMNPLNTYHLFLTSDGFTDQTVLSVNGMGLESNPDPEGFIKRIFSEIAKRKKSLSPSEILEILKEAVTQDNAKPPDDLTIGIMELIQKHFIAFIADGHGAYQKHRFRAINNPTVETIKKIMQEFVNDVIENNIEVLLPTVPQQICIKTWLYQYSKEKLSTIILRLLLLTINFKKTHSSIAEECFKEIQKAIISFYQQKIRSYENLLGDIYIIVRNNMQFLTINDKNLYSTLETCSVKKEINPLVDFLDYLNIQNDFTYEQFKLFSTNLQLILKHEAFKQNNDFDIFKKIFNPYLDHSQGITSSIFEIAIALKQNSSYKPSTSKKLSHKRLTSNKKAASNSLPELAHPLLHSGNFSKSSPALLSHDIKIDLHILLTQFLQKTLYQSIEHLKILVKKHGLERYLQELPTLDSICVDDVKLPAYPTPSDSSKVDNSSNPGQNFN